MASTIDNTLAAFMAQLASAFEQRNCVKLLLSKYKGQDKDLLRLAIRPVEIKNQALFSFVYSYQTRTITQNYTVSEALALIEAALEADFKAAHLTTSEQELQLNISKKGKIMISSHAVQNKATQTVAHNREKQRFVSMDRPFLTALGVTDQQQQLIPSMSRKWKQINKFIEVFSQALESSDLAAADKNKASTKDLQVVDFGSGKGYLTFAVHDFLREKRQLNAQVTGVELRQELADLCNTAADNLEHKGLNFVCGDVKTHAPQHTDVMIALHACDVATDYAIHYGIQAQASIIMCSPCCHKQIRPQMQSPALFKPMLQYGVHLGQEAEMVTDSLRALLLEANGYKTKIFEFISLEHTNKNKMILAVKRQTPIDNTAVLKQIAEIKAFYGIQDHCLETLLTQSKLAD